MAIGGRCEQIDTSPSASTSVCVRVQVYLCSFAVWVTEITSHTVLDNLRLWNRLAADHMLFFVCLLLLFHLHYAKNAFIIKRSSNDCSYLAYGMVLLQILYCNVFPHNKQTEFKETNNACSVKSSHCLFYEGRQWYQHNTRFPPCRDSETATESLSRSPSPLPKYPIPVCARASCRMDFAVNAPRPLWRAPLTFEENPQTSATPL